MGRQYVERTQDFRGQIRPVIGERLHQAAPAFPVRAEDGFGLAEVALEDYGGARGEWMDGGAEIVEEAGQREFERARGAARLRLRFEDVNAHAALRKGDGSGEAVGSGANDAGPARALSGCGHWRGGGSGGHSMAMMRPFASRPSVGA